MLFLSSPRGLTHLLEPTDLLFSLLNILSFFSPTHVPVPLISPFKAMCFMALRSTHTLLKLFLALLYVSFAFHPVIRTELSFRKDRYLRPFGSLSSLVQLSFPGPVQFFTLVFSFAAVPLKIRSACFLFFSFSGLGKISI